MSVQGERGPGPWHGVVSGFRALERAGPPVVPLGTLRIGRAQTLPPQGRSCLWGLSKPQEAPALTCHRALWVCVTAGLAGVWPVATLHVFHVPCVLSTLS